MFAVQTVFRRVNSILQLCTRNIVARNIWQMFQIFVIFKHFLLKRLKNSKTYTNENTGNCMIARIAKNFKELELEVPTKESTS